MLISGCWKPNRKGNSCFYFLCLLTFQTGRRSGLHIQDENHQCETQSKPLNKQLTHIGGWCFAPRMRKNTLIESESRDEQSGKFSARSDLLLDVDWRVGNTRLDVLSSLYFLVGLVTPSTNWKSAPFRRSFVSAQSGNEIIRTGARGRAASTRTLGARMNASRLDPNPAAQSEDHLFAFGLYGCIYSLCRDKVVQTILKMALIRSGTEKRLRNGQNSHQSHGRSARLFLVVTGTWWPSILVLSKLKCPIVLLKTVEEMSQRFQLIRGRFYFFKK